MLGRQAIAIAVVSGALFIGGCSAAATSGPSPSPAATAAASAAATPQNRAVPTAIQGNYKATIAGSTVSPGEWNMQITGTDIFAKNPGPGADSFAIGVVDITDDQVTFRADPECTPGAPKKEGTYSYALVNNELRFTVIDDLCLDRKSLLTAAPWERQP